MTTAREPSPAQDHAATLPANVELCTWIPGADVWRWPGHRRSVTHEIRHLRADLYNEGRHVASPGTVYHEILYHGDCISYRRVDHARGYDEAVKLISDMIEHDADALAANRAFRAANLPALEHCDREDCNCEICEDDEWEPDYTDCSGVIGANGQVYSDAAPGL